MAETIEAEFGIKAELIAGGGGIFKVCVDGTPVYDGKGSVPEQDAVLVPLRKHLGA